jgi:hypothetical protein
VAKVSPRNLKHLASESIDVLERYDETREKAVYYAQFSLGGGVPETGWRTLCRPAGQAYKTTKGEAFDLEGLTSNLAHKSVFSACYLVMLVVRRVEWSPRRVGGLDPRLGFMGEYWEPSLGSLV